MSNQLLRIVVIVGTIFPFVVVGYKLFEEESLLTAGIYTLVVVALFATILAAWRTKPTAAEAPPHDGREPHGRA